MTDQALDSMLRRVLLDADCQQYSEAIDELPECDFSPAFEKKMQKLIRRASHPIRYRIAQIAACLLLAALLSGCTVLAVSPEARAAFVGWVRTFYTPEEFPPYYRYTYSGEEAPQLPEGVAYRPTWVPEGYQVLDECHNSPGHTHITFENADGNQMDFICMTEGGVLQIIPDKGDEVKETQVSGLPADLYLSANSSALIWNSEDGALLFWICGMGFSEDALLRMAESVCLTLPRQPPHRPSWHPEAFYLGGSRMDANGLDVYFTDEADQTIHSYYARPHYVEELLSEIEQAVAGLTPQTVQVQADEAELYEGEGSSYLVWPVEDGLYWLHGPVEGEVLLRIAESMGVEAVQ